MPDIATVGSMGSGHDTAEPRAAVEGESLLLINGKAAHLTGHVWAPHGSDKHTGVGMGSMPFEVNGKKQCFTTDMVSCGSIIVTGDSLFTCDLGFVPGAFQPTPQNNFLFGDDDAEWTPERVSHGINQGYYTQEEYNQVPVENQTDDAPPPNVEPVVTECGLSIDPNAIDYGLQLSPRVKLKDVSIDAVVSKNRIKAQNGLSEADIICNLKHVAENVIEQIKAKWPNVMITSAFRTGSGASQHLRGQAIDMQFPGVSKSFYFQAAQWMKDNLPYDQLLLEYKSTGTRLPWIHISLKRSGNRRQVLTFWNHRTHGQGLIDLAGK